MSKLSWGGSISSWALESEEADEAAARAAPPPDLFQSPDESTATSEPQLKKFNNKGAACYPNGFREMGATSCDLSSDCSNYNVCPRMQEAANWGSMKEQQPLYRNPGPALGGGDKEKESMRERPKLVLERRKIELGATGKSLYWCENVDQKMDTNEEESKERKMKVNPFGDARPREVLLEEKGKDWRKIDLELEHRKVVREEGLRVVKRSDLNETMAAKLPFHSVGFGCQIVAVETDVIPSFPVIYLGDGSIIKTKVLIGCDGSNSVVAKALGLKEPKLFQTREVRGFTNYPNGHNYHHFLHLRGGDFFLGRVPVDDKLIFWFIDKEFHPTETWKQNEVPHS